MADSRADYGVNRKTVTRQKALAFNNLAWLLTTCENPQIRDHQQALSLARRAVEIASDEPSYWNTLGVAYFRLQEWDKATQALNRSMELSNNGQGDSHDWFFLAMIHARKNEKDEARQWYDRAVARFHKVERSDRELYRFQLEAAAALGIPNPGPPVITTQPGPRQFARPLPSQRKMRRTSSDTTPFGQVSRVVSPHA